MSKARQAARSRGARLADRAGAAALRGLAWLLQRAPIWVGLVLARVIAALWYAVDARHRHVADENLRYAFGDALSAAERARIVRGVFGNVASTAVEFLCLPRWSYDDLVEFIALEQLELIDEALAEGAGVILLAAHFGNWEMMASGAALRGWPLAAVARPLDQPAINAAVTALRESSGLKIIQRRMGALAAVRTLRRGKILGILADQNTRRDNVFVEFFGRPAATTPAPAYLALKTGAPILPCYLIRTGPRRFRMRVEPRLPLVVTGDMEQDVLINTQRCATELERMVRLYPENWFWIHRRWKTQPPAGWTPPHVPEAETVRPG